MTKKKLKDFPYSEKEFTAPADELINIVTQYHFRLHGDKPSWKEVMEMCKVILEERKR